jgi:hypothetical protein
LQREKKELMFEEQEKAGSRRLLVGREQARWRRVWHGSLLLLQERVTRHHRREYSSETATG